MLLGIQVNYLPLILMVGLSTGWYNSQQNLADGSVRKGNQAQNTNLNLGLIANWTLFEGFKTTATRNKLSVLQALGEANTKFYIEQTVSDITVAYYQMFYEKSLLKNYLESLEISRYRFQVEQKKKEIGASNAVNYGLAIVDYHTDSINYMAQQNTIASLQIALNRLLNMDLLNNTLPTSSNFELIQLPSIDSLLTAISRNNVSMEQSKLRELIAENDLRLAKANHYPKIDLFAGYQYNVSQSEVGFVKSNSNLGPTIGINVSFNLFNGGAVKREVSNTNLLEKNNQIATEDTKLNIQAQVYTLHQQYISVSQKARTGKSKHSRNAESDRCGVATVKQRHH
jgi:outer membrane protein